MKRFACALTLLAAGLAVLVLPSTAQAVEISFFRGKTATVEFYVALLVTQDSNTAAIHKSGGTSSPGTEPDRYAGPRHGARRRLRGVAGWGAPKGPNLTSLAGSEAEDLLEIRKVFSRLRPKTLNLAGADLEGAGIPGIDLSGARLEGAKLTRADLRQASLDRALLSKAVLIFADLRQGSAVETDFSGADLSYLDAQDASFRGADLRNADLSFARFVRADLEGARREGSQTTGTAFLETRQLDLRLLLGHSGAVRSVAWSPDGRFIATGSDDGTVKLWDAESGRLLNSRQGHENSVLTVAWAPDGRRIASASHDKTVRLWDAETGKKSGVFKMAGTVRSFLWTADGPPLVLTTGRGFIEIWDLTSNPPRPLARLYHTPGGSGFAATPDGYVSGPPEAFEYVRFGDGWALYDLTDVPERLSPERVAAALNPVRPAASGRRGGRKREG